MLQHQLFKGLIGDDFNPVSEGKEWRRAARPIAAPLVTRDFKRQAGYRQRQTELRIGIADGTRVGEKTGQGKTTVNANPLNRLWRRNTVQQTLKRRQRGMHPAAYRIVFETGVPELPVRRQMLRQPFWLKAVGA